MKEQTMLDKSKTLEISAEEFEVIQAALHTQSQILNVQASAGGNGARNRLNQVKRVLARMGQHSPVARSETSQKPCVRTGILAWLGMARTSC